MLLYARQTEFQVSSTERLVPQMFKLFLPLYKTLVRLFLEYAAPVWCPYLVKDILTLEKARGEHHALH